MTANIRRGKRPFAGSPKPALVPGLFVIVLSLLLSNVGAVRAQISVADTTATETPTSEAQPTATGTADAAPTMVSATDTAASQPSATGAMLTATPSPDATATGSAGPRVSAASISFHKIYPAHLALVPETDQFQLSWSDAGIVLEGPDHDRYQYCIDETNDNICNTAWVPKSNLQTAAGDVVVVVGHTYYWQVQTEHDLVFADRELCWTSFTVVPSTTKIISGSVGLPGVTVSYAGTTNGSANSGVSGAYSITVPNHWSGTVTPSRSGYSFSPGSRAYLDVMANQINQDYVPGLAIVYTISGDVGLEGVSMNYAGGSASGSSPSVLGGGYSFAVPAGWTGVVSPFKSGFVFTPTNKSYFGVLANQTVQNYATTSLFTDVPVLGKEWMEPWIVAFYQHGVTTGCGVAPLIYCPENQVTRAEMAVFLLRAKHGAGYAPPALESLFQRHARRGQRVDGAVG